MSEESISFRVEYGNGSVYHLIASTDMELIEGFDDYFRGIDYTPRNGLASLFSCSEYAKEPDELRKSVFVPNGDARDAAEKLIERLNVLNGAEKPLFTTEY